MPASDQSDDEIECLGVFTSTLRKHSDNNTDCNKVEKDTELNFNTVEQDVFKVGNSLDQTPCQKSSVLGEKLNHGIRVCLPERGKHGLKKISDAEDLDVDVEKEPSEEPQEEIEFVEKLISLGGQRAEVSSRKTKKQPQPKVLETNCELISVEKASDIHHSFTEESSKNESSAKSQTDILECSGIDQNENSGGNVIRKIITSVREKCASIRSDMSEEANLSAQTTKVIDKSVVSKPISSITDDKNQADACAKLKQEIRYINLSVNKKYCKINKDSNDLNNINIEESSNSKPQDHVNKPPKILLNSHTTTFMPGYNNTNFGSVQIQSTPSLKELNKDENKNMARKRICINGIYYCAKDIAQPQDTSKELANKLEKSRDESAESVQTNYYSELQEKTSVETQTDFSCLSNNNCIYMLTKDNVGKTREESTQTAPSEERNINSDLKSQIDKSTQSNYHFKNVEKIKSNLFPKNVFDEILYRTLGVNGPSQQFADDLSVDTAHVSRNNIFDLTSPTLPSTSSSFASQNYQQLPAPINKLLIKISEDIKSCLIEDENGNLPLHLAIMDNNLAKIKSQCIVLKYLRSHLNHINFAFDTPLILAVKIAIDLKKYDAVTVLLAEGVDQSIVDQFGMLPLHYAARYGCMPLLKILLSAESSSLVLNKFSYDGFAAIHLAAMEGHEQAVEYLIMKGADIDIKDRKSGRTAYYHAVERNKISVAVILRMLKASTTEPNFAGQQPPAFKLKTPSSTNISDLPPPLQNCSGPTEESNHSGKRSINQKEITISRSKYLKNKDCSTIASPNVAKTSNSYNVSFSKQDICSKTSSVDGFTSLCNVDNTLTSVVPSNIIAEISSKNIVNTNILLNKNNSVSLLKPKFNKNINNKAELVNNHHNEQSNMSQSLLKINNSNIGDSRIKSFQTRERIDQPPKSSVNQIGELSLNRYFKKLNQKNCSVINPTTVQQTVPVEMHLRKIQTKDSNARLEPVELHGKIKYSHQALVVQNIDHGSTCNKHYLKAIPKSIPSNRNNEIIIESLSSKCGVQNTQPRFNHETNSNKPYESVQKIVQLRMDNSITRENLSKGVQECGEPRLKHNISSTIISSKTGPECNVSQHDNAKYNNNICLKNNSEFLKENCIKVSNRHNFSKSDSQNGHITIDNEDFNESNSLKNAPEIIQQRSSNAIISNVATSSVLFSDEQHNRIWDTNVSPKKMSVQTRLSKKLFLNSEPEIQRSSDHRLSDEESINLGTDDCDESDKDCNTLSDCFNNIEAAAAIVLGDDNVVVNRRKSSNCSNSDDTSVNKMDFDSNTSDGNRVQLTFNTYLDKFLGETDENCDENRLESTVSVENVNVKSSPSRRKRRSAVKRKRSNVIPLSEESDNNNAKKSINTRSIPTAKQMKIKVKNPNNNEVNFSDNSQKIDKSLSKRSKSIPNFLNISNEDTKTTYNIVKDDEKQSQKRRQVPKKSDASQTSEVKNKRIKTVEYERKSVSLSLNEKNKNEKTNIPSSATKKSERVRKPRTILNL